jgi:hypothetical protein
MLLPRPPEAEELRPSGLIELSPSWSHLLDKFCVLWIEAEEREVRKQMAQSIGVLHDLAGTTASGVSLAKKWDRSRKI